MRVRERPRQSPRRGQISRGSRVGFALGPRRPAMLVGGAPLPGRRTRNDRRGRPARALPGGGRPDGGAPGSRSKVFYVPAAAPPSAARGPGLRRPVGLKVCQVPAATPFVSGLPAILGCAARRDFHYWRARIIRSAFNDLPNDRSGPPGRVPTWRSAFPADGVIPLANVPHVPSDRSEIYAIASAR